MKGVTLSGLRGRSKADQKQLCAAWRLPMTITAYNHGIAGVLRAKKEMAPTMLFLKITEEGASDLLSRNFYSNSLLPGMWRKITQNISAIFG